VTDYIVSSDRGSISICTNHKWMWPERPSNNSGHHNMDWRINHEWVWLDHSLSITLLWSVRRSTNRVSMTRLHQSQLYPQIRWENMNQNGHDWLSSSEWMRCVRSFIDSYHDPTRRAIQNGRDMTIHTLILAFRLTGRESIIDWMWHDHLFFRSSPRVWRHLHQKWTWLTVQYPTHVRNPTEHRSIPPIRKNQNII
jgi:hypothetical protein